jgi:hypothetical protein
MRRGGPEPTLRWVDSILGDDENDWNFKKSAFRRGARAVARWHPEDAAEWVLDYQEENYGERGVQFVAEQWAEQNGVAAMQWVHDRPAGKPRDEALHSAFLRWSSRDREGAAKWLRSESLSAFHDPAIDAHARQLDKHKPKEALEWCERIVDADRQYGCFRATATEWYRKDAVAAEEWLQASRLSEEDRRIVRTPKQQKKRQRGPASPR